MAALVQSGLELKPEYIDAMEWASLYISWHAIFGLELPTFSSYWLARIAAGFQHAAFARLTAYPDWFPQTPLTRRILPGVRTTILRKKVQKHC